MILPRFSSPSSYLSPPRLLSSLLPESSIPLVQILSPLKFSLIPLLPLPPPQSIMFRQSLKRCAQLRVATAAPRVTRQHVSLLNSVPQSSRSTLQTTARLSNRFVRWYSEAAEASASEQASQDQSPSAPTRFDELPALGVHPNLVKSITQGMGYETLSEVQSKTIIPALKGTDL